jgi:hypothetical protein
MTLQSRARKRKSTVAGRFCAPTSIARATQLAREAKAKLPLGPITSAFGV